MRSMKTRAGRVGHAHGKLRTKMKREEAEATKKVLWLFTDAAKTARRNRQTTKLAEYEKSLRNIQLFGREDTPTGNPVGVNIEVPIAGGEN